MTLAERTLRVAVAGNPNTGKTTLFNQLTGSRAKVGNYPGVTVERHVGELTLPKTGTVQVVDVPGTYSLAARSAEEQLALQSVVGLSPLERPDACVLVVDATNLTRNLYLALQLIELGVPVVVGLNMIDRLEETGQRIDVKALRRELGLPVVELVARRGEGIDELLRELDLVLADPERGRTAWRWSPEEEPLLDADVRAVAAEVPESWAGGSEERARALALWALLSVEEEDELDVPAGLRDVVQRKRKLAEVSGRRLDEEIIRGRYGWLDAAAPRFLREEGEKRTLTDRIDAVLLQPVLGFVLFLALMTVVFQSLFAWADPMIGAIEDAFGWLGDLAATSLPQGFWNDLVVEGVVAGVGGVLVFLPQILLLFLFIGFLEDSGYMARVAVLMDRVMRSLGLHGRAFVPMLSGYACAVPAILATRTMERKRDRLLTMMVVPLMTCSARLPVYGLLIAAVVPLEESSGWEQGLLLAGMYLFSTVIAMLAAAVLGRTVLPGQRTPLLIEMPPYRLPHLTSVARMMMERSLLFVKEAGTVILACTIGMWLLLSFPSDPDLDVDYEAERSALAAGDEEGRAALEQAESGARLRASYAGRVGQAIEPTIEPLGFDWKIGIGLIGAFAAREVFVSTMAVVYGLDEGEDESSVALRDRIRNETRSDGSRVYTPLTCISLMVFFALACQCMSTVAVVKRETNGYRWPTFLFVYMTALAWVASLIVFQGGRLLGFE